MKKEIEKDLSFLKEMKKCFEDRNDCTSYELGLQMIDDWIQELQEVDDYYDGREWRE